MFYRSCAIMALATTSAILAAPASAAEPNRIVYWGNEITGASVRVFNKAGAEQLARAQVDAKGGGGWVQLLNSTTPGFGAAICRREGSVIRFYVAHGYPSGREAVTAAKAKAEGGGSFCSNALWHVAGVPTPTEPTMIDLMKGGVRKLVTCPEEPEKIGRAEVKLPPGAPKRQDKPTDPKSRSRYACFGARG